jgi:hypothetical protein
MIRRQMLTWGALLDRDPQTDLVPRCPTESPAAMPLPIATSMIPRRKTCPSLKAAIFELMSVSLLYQRVVDFILAPAIPAHLAKVNVQTCAACGVAVIRN